MEKESKDELQDIEDDKPKLLQTDNCNTGESYMTIEDLKHIIWS